MTKRFKRFMNEHIWFRESLKANKKVKEAFIMELQKIQERSFTHNSWTEEDYHQYENILKEKIKKLDDMRIKSINNGV